MREKVPDRRSLLRREAYELVAASSVSFRIKCATGGDAVVCSARGQPAGRIDLLVEHPEVAYRCGTGTCGVTPFECPDDGVVPGGRALRCSFEGQRLASKIDQLVGERRIEATQERVIARINERHVKGRVGLDDALVVVVGGRGAMPVIQSL